MDKSFGTLITDTLYEVASHLGTNIKLLHSRGVGVGRDYRVAFMKKVCVFPVTHAKAPTTNSDIMDTGADAKNESASRVLNNPWRITNNLVDSSTIVLRQHSFPHLGYLWVM